MDPTPNKVLADGTKLFNLIRVGIKNAEGKIVSYCKIAAHEFDAAIHALVDDAGKEIKQADAEASAAEAKVKADAEAAAAKVIDFSRMSLDQLKQFAAANAVDLAGAISKADTIKALEAWKEKNNL